MKRFAISCFSLLINATDLDTSDQIFESISIIYLSQNYIDLVKKCLDVLQVRIYKRENLTQHSEQEMRNYIFSDVLETDLDNIDEIEEDNLHKIENGNKKKTLRKDRRFINILQK